MSKSKVSKIYKKQLSQKNYFFSLDALLFPKDCTFHVIWGITGIVHKDLLYRRSIKLKTSQSNELCDPI